MNRSKRIAKTLSLITVAEIISRLYPLILLHFIIKRIGIENFGAANYAVAAIDMGSPLVTLGFSFAAALAIKATSDKQNHNQIVSSVFWSRLVIACVLFTGLQLAANFGALASSEHKYLIQIASVGLLFTAFESEYVFALRQTFSRFGIIIIAAKTVVFSLTLWLVQTSDDTPLYVFLYQLHAGFICIGSFLYSLKFFKLSLPSWQTTKFLLVSAGWISVSNVMFFIIDRMEILVAEAAFSSLAASSYLIGIYAGPYRIVQSAAPFATMISKVFYSETLASPNKEQLTRIMNYQHLIINAILIGGGVFSFFYADPILGLLLGSEYIGTATLFSLLLLAAAFGSSSLAYIYQVMWTFGAAKIASLLQIATGLAIIFLGYWAGKNWGLTGFAGTILAIKAGCFIAVLCFSKKHVVRWPKQEWWIIGNSCLVLAAAAYLTRTMTWYYAGTISGIAYTGALILFAMPLIKETLAALKD